MLDSSSVSQEKVNDLWFEGDHPYLRDEVASSATVVLQKMPAGPDSLARWLFRLWAMARLRAFSGVGSCDPTASTGDDLQSRLNGRHKVQNNWAQKQQTHRIASQQR